MEIRFQQNPESAVALNTEQLRRHFLVQELFRPDAVHCVYTHYDRVIIGGVMPVTASVPLPNPDELKADYFLQRREMGIFNVGGEGRIKADGQQFSLQKGDCLYLGKETREVVFESQHSERPALFYFLSAPAHKQYETQYLSRDRATALKLGEAATSNKRTLYKFIHEDGIRSCQLVMGYTELEPGCVWNSVPPHTHSRRMEVYFYYDVSENHRVFHFMGEPMQSRHLVVANHEAVISPPWSLHFGCGTSNYGFIWGMAGENQQFTDMDPVAIADIE
ncbi:MAG: 5-dehydro-4-deoxy-D-glucuronate isomerase [Chitinophagaceae bacterium]|nr:5-dehydro-4-deoxy-D-glucuronate isomerase [Chitinophagaceae bacterium]